MYALACAKPGINCWRSPSGQSQRPRGVIGSVLRSLPLASVDCATSTMRWTWALKRGPLGSEPSIAHHVSTGQQRGVRQRTMVHEHSGNKERPVLAAPVLYLGSDRSRRLRPPAVSARSLTARRARPFECSNSSSTAPEAGGTAAHESDRHDHLAPEQCDLFVGAFEPSGSVRAGGRDGALPRT